MKLTAQLIPGNLPRARRLYLEAQEVLFEETLLGELVRLLQVGGSVAITSDGQNERLFHVEDDDGKECKEA